MTVYLWIIKDVYSLFSILLTPGPGFRLSETQAVRVLKQLEDWFPFYDEEDFPNPEKKSVRTK